MSSVLNRWRDSATLRKRVRRTAPRRDGCFARNLRLLIATTMHNEESSPLTELTARPRLVTGPAARQSATGNRLISQPAYRCAPETRYRALKSVQRPPAVHFQPRTFGTPWQPRQNDLQHRPDAPGARRSSPPEVVTKVLRALEEMGEPVGPSMADKVRTDPTMSLEFLLRPNAPSARTG